MMTTPPAATFLNGWKLNKHGLERDTQRVRVYRAELETFPEMASTEEFKSTQAVHGYLTEVLDHNFSKWFPYLTLSEVTSLRNEFSIFFKARGRSSCGRIPRHNDGWPAIELVKAHRNKWLVLHELAHNVTPPPHSWHGSLFCHNYLLLVRELLGADEAAKLKEAFIKHKVRYTT